MKPKDGYTVSFVANKAGLTKTAANEGETTVSYVWTDEDVNNIKLFTVTDGTLAEVSSPTVTRVSDTQLKISATVDEAGTYTFRAILCNPESWTGSGNDYTSRKPKVNTTQSPNGISNFDPNADILVSDDLNVVVEEDSASDMLMTFRRQIVVNKMTLKNMTAGEKVSKVTVTADKDITGYLNNGSMSGQNKVITLHYSDVEVPSNGQFPVYFISMNQTEVSLTIDVVTDQNTYSKSFAEGKTIDLNLGQFTKFNVALPAGTPITDLSGYYLIGCLYGGKWQLMDSNISGSYYPKFESSVTTAAASVNFDEFSGIANIDPYLWKVEAYDGAYSIKSVATGNYLSYSGNTNAAQAASELGDATKFSITISGTTATIESTNATGRVLKYNSGSPRFAFYASGQNDIFMIPATYDSRTVVTLSFDESSVSKTTDNYTEFTGKTATADPDVTAVTGNITYAISGDAIGTVDASTGTVSLNGTTGEATVTATFAGDETYRPATASYTISVTEAGTTTYYYEEMTEAPTDWTAETYIIIAGTSVLNTSATSSWGGVTTVTKETDGTVKSTEALKLLEVKLAGNSTDGYTIQFVNAGTQYYVAPLTSNGFSLVTTAPTNKIDVSISSISHHTTTARNLRLNGTSGFRWYANTTGTAAVLYKKVAN